MLVEVTKLNDTKILINTMQIEYVEQTPDTVVVFTSGRKLIIKESRSELLALIR